MEKYIENVTARFGKFEHAPENTAFDPASYEEYMLSFLKTNDQSEKVVTDKEQNDEEKDEDIELDEQFQHDESVVKTPLNDKVAEDHIKKTLKRPGPQEVGADDKKLKVCLDSILEIHQKIAEEKQHLLGELARLRIELDAEKQKTIDFNTLKAELGMEKEKNVELERNFDNLQTEFMQKVEENEQTEKSKHCCIICGKECVKFCGQDCIMYVSLIL